jgi:hypothetical protein
MASLRGLAPYISVFGLILLVAGLVARGLAGVPENVALGVVVAGLLLCLAWPVLAWPDFRGVLSGRRARFGGNALLLAVAVVAGLVAVYFLGTRYYYSLDLTANQQFTLQRQTIQVLDNLEASGKPIVLTAVLGPSDLGDRASDIERLVDRYRAQYPGIQLELLNYAQDPIAFQSLMTRTRKESTALVGAIVAESGDKSAVSYTWDEQGVTEAIIKATRDQATTLYFTTGHGEPAEGSANGYGALRGGLEQEGYTVKSLDLIAMTETLKSGDVVIVAGPTRPFQPAEVERLTGFVHDPDTRGAVLLMLGSPFQYPPDTPPNLGLDPLIAPWGLSLGNDVVVDPLGQVLLGNPLLALVYNEGNEQQGWQFHTITKDLTGTRAAMPASRSLGVGTPSTTTLTAQAILSTGPQAWAETDFAALQAGEVQPDPSRQSAQTIGVVAEGGDLAGRLVAFGSAAFASDEMLGTLGQAGFSNASLVFNAINWLAADEDLISIRPTAPDSRPLSIPDNGGLLWLFLAIVFPLAILGVGVYAWWRRR